MAKPVILCVDDQREVLAALTKDLEPLSGSFDLVDAESADEAIEVLDELEQAGQPVALIISDHVMPGTSGVDLLTRIHAQRRLPYTRKLLLTGLATHEDTIRAINQAEIDQYIAKPWEPSEMLAIVKKLITHFVFDRYPDNYNDFRTLLDGEVIVERMQQRDSD